MKICIVLLMAALSLAAQKPASPKPDDKFRGQIVAQERAGLDALKTGDLTSFGNSTAADAIFVDAQGPATKAEVLKHTAEFRLHEYTMSDVKVLRISKDSGLLVYKIVESGASHGHEFTAKVYVSSL